MAVTLTLDELRGYIETGANDADAGADYVPGWYEAAKEMVEGYAPHAPDALHNRALQMVCGYWMGSHDNTAITRDMLVEHQDTWVDSRRAGNALRFSGAMSLLTRFKKRRAR